MKKDYNTPQMEILRLNVMDEVLTTVPDASDSFGYNEKTDIWE